jgi:TonB family protein
MRSRRPLCRLLAAAALVASWPAPSAFAQAPAPAVQPRLTKPPKLVKFVEAEYPESERATGKAANVKLEIAIDAEGGVDEVRVVESAGAAFDEAALAAVRQFQFEPAEVDGKPAPVRIQYRYEFALRAAAPPTTAELKGVVRDRRTGQPLAGVTVELGSGQRAVTDERGEFRFEGLEPGAVSVQLSAPELTPVRTEETLAPGQRLQATYEVETKTPEEVASGEVEDLEIFVTAQALRKEVLATEVGAEQARRVAGTQGDVMKVVENLPGVGRSAAGSGRIVVWGAAPEDTRVYVDGVRIPILYHSGGLRSVLLSDQVASVELVPGAYGPAYGRGIGGLVGVKLARFTPAEPGKVSAWHGSVGADLIDASASVRVPVGKDFHVAGGVRQSYLDSLLPVFSDEDVGEFFPIPRTTDVIARAAYVPSRRSSLEIGGLYSRDAVDRTVPSVDPTQFKQESRRLEFWRTWARWEADLEGGASVNVVPWFGRDESSLVNRFGATPTELETGSTLYGLRAAWRGRVEGYLTVTAGVDGEIVASRVSRAGATASPAREGDIRVFGQALADQINFDEWHTVITSVAPYGELDFGLFDDALHVVPSLRFEPYLTSVDRRIPTEGDEPSRGVTTEHFALEPRLALRYRPDPRVLFKAAVGRYHQPPQPEDLSSVFGNPKLATASATHVLFGADVQILRQLGIETSVFYTRSEELAVRSPSAAPLVAEALLAEGEGRSFGVQLLLKKELADRWFGWIAHSISRSERRRSEDAPWRLSDYDQTHVSTLVTSYDLGAGFEVGVRGRIATGYPRTPVRGAFYDSRRDQFEPLFGPQNSIRIPMFWQVDARVSKRFKIATSELETYVDVQNVTNHENEEEFVYSADYRERRAITGLPVLPVAGARLSW